MNMHEGLKAAIRSGGIFATDLDPEAIRKDNEERPEHIGEVSGKAVLYWRRRLAAKTAQCSGLFRENAALKKRIAELEARFPNGMPDASHGSLILDIKTTSRKTILEK